MVVPADGNVFFEVTSIVATRGHVKREAFFKPFSIMFWCEQTGGRVIEGRWCQNILAGADPVDHVRHLQLKQQEAWANFVDCIRIVYMSNLTHINQKVLDEIEQNERMHEASLQAKEIEKHVALLEMEAAKQLALREMDSDGGREAGCTECIEKA
eukprot:1316526-Amphidinium_carterae.1